MAWFMRRDAWGGGRSVQLGSHAAGRVLAGPGLFWTLRLVGLAVFVVLVAIGLFGPQQPFKNITPIAVWVLWWVGFAYLAAFVGNFWPLVNPWLTVYDLVRWGRPAARPVTVYPDRWGIAPAVLLLAGFVAMELAWTKSEVPRALALAMLGYSALTWTGMAVFGRDQWLARGEVFSVYFGVLGRFAPLTVRSGPHRLVLGRPLAIGLLVKRPA